MKHLQVAVGIIRDKQQNIFLAKRSAELHMGNMWEFPGGKIEPDETAEQALRRELLEETGIEVVNAVAWDTSEHSDAQLRVTLHFFIVEEWRGEPWGREGQPQRWVAQRELVANEFPPANIPVVARLLEEAK
ncbi:8-oxo-dGTP diphosphatase MutT [Erwinia tracheiphila]|uniref:8-oxo-dGTP diphosphatase n=1 Tax=Erwinia tracheiphila TaxID=65700 RepID=A0A0M2KAY8_9GAMM|nr:8-oxo-dGTP diphosphatase MutT [Erwinia tracheiphila]AXF77240.1 8-oxo-dGTP diphosphatase MutT [Erwinia tracheiphila]EOS94959.1 7,8-dihydro-8-oxoguanine-triphosphatase [Erwinia tracheiphila PSU-1]KKF36114.1 nucleoside triphosphate hydrolase [Erwinia tracheiphila]UIA84068.1 8-oxo-dGTP diphosphatase MutT [Erwinia tracheiphila]UIA87431.1 8-oxo-dGTP diphosphatase MutT [Erwinia tracheiphila]